MKKLIILLFFPFFCNAQQGLVQVLMFNDLHFSSVTITANKGSFEVLSSHNKTPLQLSAGDMKALALTCAGVGIHINGTEDFGEYDNFYLHAKDTGCLYSLAIPGAGSGPFVFEDDLEVKRTGNDLQLISHVAIEKYVADVMACEIGSNTQPEFLKAKAIICRTYALSSMDRHIPNSNMLCSGVHCQVYKGRNRVTKQIMQAVIATEGEVIRDRSGKLIVAAFHSNCGGMTQNSEDAWLTSLPYLRSVRDTFCRYQPNSRWEKRISMIKWKSYLTTNLNEQRESDFCDSEWGSFDHIFPERKKFYTYKGVNIPVKKLREDWGFKSSWFSITELEDSLLVVGRGYGHGVGLCQEGAMKMAENGFSAEKIISFYYQSVVITH